MKKLILALSLLTLTGTAMAQHYHGHGLRHHGPRVIYRDNWVAPAVGALIIGAAINEAHHRHNQQPVIIQQQTIPPSINCTEWKEIQTPDGRIYRERICNQ